MTQLRTAAASVASAALALVMGLPGSAGAQPQPEARPQAQAQPPAEHVCYFEGRDQNDFLDVTQRLIGPPPCREAFVGERWVRTFPSWGTAPSAEGAVYPAGYTPQRPAPMDDFLAKFRGVRVVNDIGTVRERSFTFGPETVRLTEIDRESGLPFTYFATAPLPPLSPGEHTSTVFMRLSAEHCDGLGTVEGENCLPGGEFPYPTPNPITVTFFPRNPA
ncbi:hypothetical protein KV205_09755 [Streptomyces sp. SKN60]|uniref:hypothetical protein n=1 Tax=Streptomyces sp. SKN60 TaxID=2855506 RepID=UPI002245D651|nr:hypothetical protein [Streptomyces sp. SKN60]MCX2180811.1 hypothetical protein [Streptomyces sp. SKN60]